MSQENVEIGLGAFDVAGLPRRQVEERLLALVELDSGRQSVADRLDQVGLRRTHKNRPNVRPTPDRNAGR